MARDDEDAGQAPLFVEVKNRFTSADILSVPEG